MEISQGTNPVCFAISFRKGLLQRDGLGWEHDPLGRPELHASMQILPSGAVG